MAIFTRSVETGIGINASPERVWQILTDFARYPEWNPFIIEVEGTPARGARLYLRLESPAGRTVAYRVVVRESESPTSLRWLRRLGVPWLFDGEHSFEVEALRGAGVHFRQEERFRGVLLPFMRRSVGRSEADFRRMNWALAARAEDSA